MSNGSRVCPTCNEAGIAPGDYICAACGECVEESELIYVTFCNNCEEGRIAKWGQPCPLCNYTPGVDGPYTPDQLKDLQKTQ